MSEHTLPSNILLHNHLPDGFQFSQGSLQDFVDCKRRFQLRYILGLAWPGLQSEPALENERRMQQGARFHRLLHQYLLGVPPDRLESLTDNDLGRWWMNFRRYFESLSAQERPIDFHPEITLSSPLGGYRLVAKYDLILVQPGGRFTIFDWKTSHRKPRREWLEKRMQTLAYPYLLIQTGDKLNSNNPISPEDIEMVYWFAEYPETPERFDYSLELYQQKEAYLSGLVAEILRLTGDEFTLTERIERCRFCNYRSLCNRGIEAGPLDDLEGESEDVLEGEIFIEFDQISEIEY